MEPGGPELEKVIALTDRFITCGDPEKVAFWLGYRHGIKHHFRCIDSVIPPEESRCFIEVAGQGHRDKFIEAYAYGYQNGFDGRSPREILGERDGAKE